MCVSLSLSLSVCLSVCLVLPDDDAHGADGEPMYEASIYHPVSCIYVRMCVCVCVCARRSFNSQTPERIQRFAVRVPIGLKIKTTLE